MIWPEQAAKAWVVSRHGVERTVEQRATRVVFFITGFGMAAWAPLVPFAKARAGINDGELGLLLLCLGIGSIVTMPLSGALTARMGCRLVIIGAALLFCVALSLLATVATLPFLVAALLLFGAGLGGLDVAMNVQAIIVERASGRAMMSGFHGLFSLGAMAGAGGMTALLSAGLAPFAAMLVVIAGMIVALATEAAHLLPYGNRNEGPSFAWPRGVVLFLGILCFIGFLAEGAVLDWSAVFLTSERGMPPTYAGLGYAVFALTMTLGRLAGDRFVQWIGGGNAVLVGGLCAALGFVLTTLPLSSEGALFGYALAGVGSANIVPVLFSKAGRQTVMAETVAVPALMTLGYAGILVGPAMIGFVAHAASLSVAFLILAMLLLGVAASGRWLRL